MLTFLTILAVWVFVAASCHYRRHTYYRKHPYMWNRRGEGLIAFSDRQYWWIMTLWPMAIIAFMLFCITMGLLRIYEIAQDWWVAHRVSK